MSTTTIIILSDSDDDFDYPEHMAEYDPVTQQIYGSEDEEEPMEEDPSEEEPGSQNFRDIHMMSPLPTNHSHHATPSVTPEPMPRESVTIPGDPYVTPFTSGPTTSTHRRANAHRWTWLVDTLQTWRGEEGLLTTTETGESSVAVPPIGEPAHHTIPLLVARLARQELNMSHLQDAVEYLPGEESAQQMQHQITTLENHMKDAQDELLSLHLHMDQVIQRNSRMEQQMASLEQKLGQIDALAGTMREDTAAIPGEDHTPKRT